MSLIEVLEQDKLYKEEWGALLGIKLSVIDELLRKKIFRSNDDGYLVLTFVGVIAFEKSLLFARPKFDINRSFGLGQILSILKVYFSRSSQRAAFSKRTQEPEYKDSEVIREFDALLSLQGWYEVNGIYEKGVKNVSAQGNIHWSKTVAKCQPLIMQDSLFYPSYISELHSSFYNEVSFLQIAVLNLLRSRYGLPPRSELTSLEFGFDRGSLSWPLSDTDKNYYTQLLVMERRNVFQTAPIRLIDILIRLLNTQHTGMSNEIKIYGTTSFYSVWEDACLMLAGKKALDSPSEQLKHPRWWFIDEAGKKVYEEHKLIPDVVVELKGITLILDAKYYYPFPDQRPGTADIVKQLYYHEVYDDTDATVRSIFLLPMPSAVKPEFLGYSSIEGAKREFCEIEAWGISPIQVFSNYSTHLHSQELGIINIIANSWLRVSEFISKA